jgi:hypothetical protein
VTACRRPIRSAIRSHRGGDGDAVPVPISCAVGFLRRHRSAPVLSGDQLSKAPFPSADSVEQRSGGWSVCGHATAACGLPHRRRDLFIIELNDCIRRSVRRPYSLFAKLKSANDACSNKFPGHTAPLSENPALGICSKVSCCALSENLQGQLL